MILQQKVPEMNVSRSVAEETKKNPLLMSGANTKQKRIKHKEL